MQIPPCVGYASHAKANLYLTRWVKPKHDKEIATAL